MQMTIEVSDSDLMAYGKEVVYREFAQTLKWMKMRSLFREISRELAVTDKYSYQQELEAIREASWNEYRVGIG